MTTVTVTSITPLRRFTNSLVKVPVQAASVGEGLPPICATDPSRGGTLREFIHVYVGMDAVPEPVR
jgi:hypothetical protein